MRHRAPDPPRRPPAPVRPAAAALLFVLLAAVPASPSLDLPEGNLDWLGAPEDSLFLARGEEFDRFLATAAEMGWMEKELALREARLRLGTFEAEGRREEEKRIASLAARCGRDARAFELLAPMESTDAEAALASGIAAWRAGKNREAALLLRTAEALGAPDRDLVRFRRAEAQRALPEADFGLPLLLDIAGAPGHYRIDALQEASLELFRRERPEEALALLRREYGLSFEGLAHRELLYRAAEAERRLGRPATAAGIFRRVLETWPEHDRALDSYRALRFLEEAGTIPVDDRLPLLGARAAARAGKTEEALRILRLLIDRGERDPLGAEALLESGKVSYGAERFRTALSIFERLGPREDETGAAAVLYRARTLRKLGEYRPSIDAYAEYVRRFPSSALAPEAEWEIAWRWKLLGDEERSAEEFRRVRVLFPKSEYAPRSFLQEGLALDALGRTPEARSLIEEGLRSGLSGSDRVEATYWVASASMRLGDSTRARGAFVDLMEENPETYYGLRAAQVLGMTVIPPPEVVVPAGEKDDPLITWIRAWSGGGGGEPDYGPLPLLVRLAEWDAARREAASLRRSHESDPVALAYLARVCRRSALYDETIRCGRRIQELAEKAGANSIHPELLALIYPPAYLDLVVEQASVFEGIDPLFVVALMRQESWFHPGARSPAGARGLMQILPSTGKHLAAELGEGGEWDADRLYDPVRNIRYGMRYLRSLLDRYGGNALVAASAYNAGEASADVWSAAAGPEKGDRFIEKITYSETRTYVRRVLSGYWICRSLYPAAAADPMG